MKSVTYTSFRAAYFVIKEDVRVRCADNKLNEMHSIQFICFTKIFYEQLHHRRNVFLFSEKWLQYCLHYYIKSLLLFHLKKYYGCTIIFSIFMGK